MMNEFTNVARDAWRVTCDRAGVVREAVEEGRGRRVFDARLAQLERARSRLSRFPWRLGFFRFEDCFELEAESLGHTQALVLIPELLDARRIFTALGDVDELPGLQAEEECVALQRVDGLVGSAAFQFGDTLAVDSQQLREFSLTDFTLAADSVVSSPDRTAETEFWLGHATTVVCFPP